jgi:hypothetical protein
MFMSVFLLGPLGVKEANAEKILPFNFTSEQQAPKEVKIFLQISWV